jgi:hypothetical protein
LRGTNPHVTLFLESEGLVDILDDFLCIAVGFLGFPGYLFAKTFDLILVHDQTPSLKLTGSPCKAFRLNLMLPPVCAVTNNNINQIILVVKNNRCG